MGDDDTIKRVARLVTEAANDAPAKPARPRRTKPQQPGVVYVNASGQAQVAGRDINVNVRKITRTTVAAPPGSLTSAQAKKLRDLVEKMVDIEAAGGVAHGNRPALFAKWHSILKDRFGVASYKEIPSERADEAIAWLKQVAAMNRPKLRRTDPASWRNEHYKAIWARARERGLSKGDVYSLVLARLDKQVLSLKQLSDQHLRRLYEILMAR